MSEPVFLTLDEVKCLHLRAIKCYGGASGIRDTDLLEAAVHHPQKVYFYSRGDLFEIAAAYAFHIAEAQAFFDGNKRTAVAAALTFLRGNGAQLKIKADRLHVAMIAIAEKRMTRSELAELLRRESK